MVFKEIKKDSDWAQVGYMATWMYGYDFILDAAQVIIDMDFKNNTQKSSTFFIAGAPDEDHIYELRKAKMDECGGISIAGLSSFMDVPVQICFFNQTGA